MRESKFFKYLELHVLTKGFDWYHFQAFIFWWDSPIKLRQTSEENNLPQVWIFIAIKGILEGSQYVVFTTGSIKTTSGKNGQRTRRWLRRWLILPSLGVITVRSTRALVTFYEDDRLSSFDGLWIFLSAANKRTGKRKRRRKTMRKCRTWVRLV